MGLRQLDYLPVQVPGLINVSVIAMGGYHSFAVDADGSVWGWGFNGLGQVGDGTTTDKWNPVKLALKLSPLSATISGVPAPSPTNSSSATLAVGGAAVVSYKFKLDSGSYSSETNVAVPVSLENLEDGFHTVSFIGKNSCGNWQEEADATIVTWAVDTTAPIGTISGAPTSLNNLTTATLSVGGVDVVSYKYKLDGGGYSSETVIATPISLSSLAEGLRTVSVIGKDSADNWQEEAGATTASWTIDTTAATATLSGTPTSPTSSGTALLTVGGVDVVSYKYKLDGGGCSSETVIATPISLSGLAEGSRTVAVIGKDSAGNWQSEAGATTASWTIDTTAPSGAALVNGGAVYANGRNVTILLNSADALEVCFSNDNVNYSAWEPMAASKNWGLVAGDDSKVVYVKYRDSAGNTYITSDSIILDSTAPGVPVPIRQDESSENLPTLDWEVVSGCAYYILEYANNVSFTDAIRIENILPSDYTMDTAFADGTWYWRVRAVDAAGNMSAWSTTEILTINTSGYCNQDPEEPELCRRLMEQEVFLGHRF